MSHMGRSAVATKMFVHYHKNGGNKPHEGEKTEKTKNFSLFGLIFLGPVFSFRVSL